jgi:hypothetical protein
MNDYSNWEFMLNGNPQEFRQMLYGPSTAYFNIYGGVDHWLDCPNDDFRMTTLYCEGEDDPGTAWQIGYELISLFNGASTLLSKDYLKISIFRLLHNEVEVQHEPHRGNTALLGKPALPEARLAAEYENSKNSSTKLRLLHLATEHKDVYFILKYFDMEPGWVTYYKLLEAIEHFAKEKNIALDTIEANRKSFTNTANNFSLSGFESRHGFKEITKLNKTPAMTLDAAYDFVSGMAKKYLKLAHFQAAA